MPAEILERSKLGLSLPDLDSLSRFEISSLEFKKSFPLYLDDMFRLRSFFMSGDSLGNGYSRKFNPLGAGFDAVRVNLNGMPLNDPLTGMVDWRMLAPEIADRAIVISGGALNSMSGGAEEICLLSARTDLPVSSSQMRIAGGSYDINKLGGGLRRSLFRSGGIQVQINKIQQSTEDFTQKIEEIQYFTHLEKSLASSALLSLDGLFFSNDQRSRTGFSGKLQQKNTHIQLALTGNLKKKTGYRLAYWYASSRHPYESEAGVTHLGARSHAVAGNIVFRPGSKFSLGLDLQAVRIKLKDFPQDTPSLAPSTNYKLLGLAHLAAPGGFLFSTAAGLRQMEKSNGIPVAKVGISKNLTRMVKVSLGWEREALEPGLATRMSRYDPALGREKYPPGKLSSFEAVLGTGPIRGREFRVGIFNRQANSLTLSSYEPNPLITKKFGTLDYRINGLFYRFAGALFWGLAFRAEGVELFNPPQDVPYLTNRRHTAVLGLEGTFFRADLGYSLQAEMIYEGEFRFPYTETPDRTLRTQPGRLNFGGAGSLRIIDFTIFCRLDFLISDYYNSLDPLRLPGPRSFFGVDWEFRN
ncbi:MAG TPA: hypothetical protein VM123_12890 [archaeon]|nr:hypothetical protein [archaeon]